MDERAQEFADLAVAAGLRVGRYREESGVPIEWDGGRWRPWREAAPATNGRPVARWQDGEAFQAWLREETP